jgi:hypothetical protein
VELKLLLKRGAIIAAANWPTIAIQFAVQATFQVLLAVPIMGAAVVVAVLLGGDLAHLLAGTTRDIFEAITRALAAEPFALACFLTAFAIVLIGGSVFAFLVKGGTVAIFAAANEASGPIEREPLTFDLLQRTSRFTLEGFTSGCQLLFKRYLVLGLTLMAAYGISACAYLAVVVFGYRAAGSGGFFVGWTFLAAAAGLLLAVWITVVNVIYLLMQVVIAVENVGLVAAGRAVAEFVRADLRSLGGVFLVGLAMIVGAILASALAWSGVGLIAFVPLVGLAVFPLQIIALLVRGLVFQYIGLTALGAYITLYRRHVDRSATARARVSIDSSRGAIGSFG